EAAAPGVDGRAAGLEVVVAAGGVGEQLGGRGHEAVGVLAGGGPPTGQRLAGPRALVHVGVGHRVVVARQSGQAVGADPQGAAGAEQDVVVHHVVGGPVLQPQAGVGGLDDRVVGDQVAA